jgi:hypothetical protein
MALPYGQNHVAQMAEQQAAAMRAQRDALTQRMLTEQLMRDMLQQTSTRRAISPPPGYWLGLDYAVDAKPRKPLPISTQFGEIIAYRFWRYHRGYLKSASTDYLWMPRKIATIRENEKIEDYGSRGVHAFKDTEGMILNSYEGEIVFGTVKLWGDVIEYEKGYHAEFASIVSLDHADLPSRRADERAVLQELRGRYFLQAERSEGGSP